MEVPKQVPHVEPKDLPYGQDAQHERGAGDTPGGREGKGSVVEDLKNHTNDVCL